MSSFPRLRSCLVLIAVHALIAAQAMADPLPGREKDPFEILPPAEQYAYIHRADEHPQAIAMSEQISRELSGDWHVLLWNQFANTPRRVYGSGLVVAPGGLSSRSQVERVALDFIAAHPDIFRADPTKLQTLKVKNALGKWVVVFQQVERGFPVVDATLDLVFTESGRLYAFGTNAVQGLSIPPVPSIGEGEATSIARTAVPYDIDSEMQAAPTRVLVLPILKQDDEQAMTFRLVYRVEVPTDEPYGLYATYVDALTREIVQRENLVADAYTGSVNGDVEIPTYCSGNTANTPFADMNVVIAGVGTAVTDASGNFTIPGNIGATTFTAQFDGPQVNVNCSGCGGDATIAGAINPDSPQAVYFSSGSIRADERDCFYFLNKTYDFVKSIDPAYTNPKVTANVNLGATCNANWGGTVLNIFATGGGCHNTGEIGDVMAHEYGHCIQSQLLGGQGTQGLGEGNGDIAGTFIIDGSTIGIGFVNCSSGLSCPGSSCRDCENTLTYPANVVGQEIHDAGRVICGFNWDCWEGLEAKYGAAAGKLKCAQLWHFSRDMFGTTGMTQPDQVMDYFIIDDDDGDLTNGTPDYAELCTAATNHGFSCPAITVGVTITHTPLGNTTNTATPYDVIATIVTTAPPLKADSLLVRHRIGGTGPYTTLTMTATLNPNEYHALIPAQPCGTAIDYFIVAEDNSGNRKTSPTNAPTTTHKFTVVGTVSLYSQNFEAASDWTSDPTHTASTGAFVRIDPNATSEQPGDDATPGAGVFGWITAQNSAEGVDDVDNGIAATRSPVFDLAGLTGVHLSMKYFHGQRDQADDPSGDFFRISVSNDGGTTYPVNLVAIGDVSNLPAWTALEADLSPVISLTSTMRFRVQASDGTATGDLVEGGIDDIVLTACPSAPSDTTDPAVTVTAPNGGESFSVGAITNITWSATDAMGVTGIDILLSTDGGGSFPTTIVSNGPNGGTYAWTVPNSPTSTARIKVVARDAANNSGEDQSDANFTIGDFTPPSATLTDPNGGEALVGGSSFPITWSATDNVGVTGIDIFLSFNIGATYDATIATNEPNDGSFSWTVNNALSTPTCRVKIVAIDAASTTDEDESDADFTIGPAPSGPPSISLASPDGGESYDATTVQQITWSASDDIAVTGVDISLSLDGGATFPIAIATNEGNDGAYDWSVEDSASTTARIRVRAIDANFQTAFDASSGDFTITVAPTGLDGFGGIPARLTIGPNVPDPFSASTSVRFGIPNATRGELAVYGLGGQVVRRLASGSMPAGRWERVWDGKDDSGRQMPAGRYLLRLSTPEATVTHRLTLVR